MAAGARGQRGGDARLGACAAASRTVGESRFDSDLGEVVRSPAVGDKVVPKDGGCGAVEGIHVGARDFVDLSLLLARKALALRALAASEQGAPGANAAARAPSWSSFR